MLKLVYGEIISIKGVKAKLVFKDINGLETSWVIIPQLCTVGDKSFNTLDIGTEVAAIISDTTSFGCIIGAIYNKVDISISENKNLKFISFSDGSLIKYDKENHIFDLNVTGTVNITANKVTINGDLEVRGNVSDNKGSMQEIRNKFNEHQHSNGNNGANTGTPNNQM